MKRVLLTGASGFLGRYALQSLAGRDYEIHAVSRHPLEACGGVYWHVVDLLDEKRVEALISDVRPSHLLHLAWYAEPGKFWDSAENFRWLRATMALFDAFAASGGSRAVGAGSCAEYDWGGGCCREQTTPLLPVTVYGRCKDLARRYLELHSTVDPMTSAWGRIFHLHGPREDGRRLVASVIDALSRGQPAPCSRGDQLRDFLHAADAADALVALLDGVVTGPVNIASGTPTTVAALVLKIGELMEALPLVQLGRLPARSGDPPVLTADVARLREEVRWRPRYDLVGGLRETIAGRTGGGM